MTDDNAEIVADNKLFLENITAFRLHIILCNLLDTPLLKNPGYAISLKGYLKCFVFLLVGMVFSRFHYESYTYTIYPLRVQGKINK